MEHFDDELLRPSVLGIEDNLTVEEMTVVTGRISIDLKQT